MTARPFPARDPAEWGVMLRATNCLLSAPALERRGQAPFPGIGGGKLPARAPCATAARGAARRPDAFPPVSGLAPLAARLRGPWAGPRPPDPGATSLKAAPRSS